MVHGDNTEVEVGAYRRTTTLTATERNGNGSLAVTIPADQVDERDIEAGDVLAVRICEDGLVIDV